MANKTAYIKGTDVQVEILGPDDFEGYDYNKPGPEWELIRYPDGLQVWCGKPGLSDKPTKSE